MDEKLIIKIVRGLLSGDADIVQPIVDQYFTDDIVFEHPLFTVKGKEEFYKVYRGYYANQKAEVEFSNFMITVVQYEKPRFIPSGKLVCHSTILLHFRKDADGVTRIDLQTDHWSSLAPVLWSIGGWSAMALGDFLIKRFNKTLLCMAADIWDFFALKEANAYTDKKYAMVIKAAASTHGAESGELEDAVEYQGGLSAPPTIGSHAIRNVSRMSIESYTNERW